MAGLSDKDNGYRRLMAQHFGQADVTVGIHEAEGSAPHAESELSVAEIGAVHEYGSEEANIPERSFIRAWFDEARDDNVKAIQTLSKRVMEGKIPSVEAALNQLGLRAVGQIQKRIADGIEPELEDETIARKGSSVPLIDTGVLRSSITHEVTSK